MESSTGYLERWLYCGIYDIIHVHEEKVLFNFSLLPQYQKHFLSKVLDSISFELMNQESSNSKDLGGILSGSLQDQRLYSDSF